MNFRKLKCKLRLHDLEVYYLNKEKEGHEYACPHCGIPRYVTSERYVSGKIVIKSSASLRRLRRKNKRGGKE